MRMGGGWHLGRGREKGGQVRIWLGRKDKIFLGGERGVGVN